MRSTLDLPGWKRALDLLLASAGLLVLLPLWPAIALAIKLEDGGPVFYRHRRIGKGEEPFATRKFRSMPADNTVPVGQGRPDPADITVVGRFLRKTALDESPQLWDILRGRMSLVGPRPLMVEQVQQGLAGNAPDLTDVPGFHERHRVLPGLTGVAQVHGPWKITYRRKFRYDAFYVRNRSPRMDLDLIGRSVLNSLGGVWPGSEDRTESGP
jgi:lipopolysaccharide/colanic/teichoic acid biosynthesis glycosyltransferase